MVAVASLPDHAMRRSKLADNHHEIILDPELHGLMIFNCESIPQCTSSWGSSRVFRRTAVTAAGSNHE